MKGSTPCLLSSESVVTFLCSNHFPYNNVVEGADKPLSYY